MTGDNGECGFPVAPVSSWSVFGVQRSNEKEAKNDFWERETPRKLRGYWQQTQHSLQRIQRTEYWLQGPLVVRLLGSWIYQGKLTQQCAFFWDTTDVSWWIHKTRIPRSKQTPTLKAEELTPTSSAGNHARWHRRGCRDRTSAASPICKDPIQVKPHRVVRPTVPGSSLFWKTHSGAVKNNFRFFERARKIRPGGC